MGKREFLKRNCKSEHCNINFLKEISSAFDLIFAWECNKIATSLTDFKKSSVKLKLRYQFLRPFSQTGQIDLKLVLSLCPQNLWIDNPQHRV